MLEKYIDSFWKYSKDASVTTYCIVGTVSLYAFYRLVIKKKYKLPPGPRGLPLIGNLAALKNDDFLVKMKEWQKEFGDIITVQLGPMRMIVISDADLAINAFVDKGTVSSDRPYFYSLHTFSEGSKSITSVSLGENLKYQRKVASQSLRQYLTGNQFEERCYEVLSQMTKSIESRKDAFVVKDLLSQAVFQVMYGLCFGSVKDFDDPSTRKVDAFINTAVAEGGNGFLEDVVPLLRYWPTKKFAKVLKIVMDFTDYTREQIEERRAVMDKENPICLADTILLAQEEILNSDSASKIYMTDVHARQIVLEVFGGGVDTVIHTLNWIFLVLIAYPNIQARIHKEIDDIIGENVPGREHRAKLVYTGAVILETMRLYSVAPLGVPHQFKCDSTLGGYDIPAKTSIMINQHLILRDPKLWEDPLTFKPERFMSEDESKIILRNRGFIPFSLGPRACPGESLAKMSIFYLVVGLLQKFSFSLPPGEKADFTPDTVFFGFRASNYKIVAKSRLI